MTGLYHLRFRSLSPKSQFYQLYLVHETSLLKVAQNSFHQLDFDGSI